MARPHEERTSRLEGAYEQVADRLNSLDANMAELRRELRSEMTAGFASAGEGLTALRSEMSASYRSLIVAMTGQTALIIGAVIGVAFVMHR